MDQVWEYQMDYGAITNAEYPYVSEPPARLVSARTPSPEPATLCRFLTTPSFRAVSQPCLRLLRPSHSLWLSTPPMTGSTTTVESWMATPARVVPTPSTTLLSSSATTTAMAATTMTTTMVAMM